jgi:hypothetical protein
MGWVAALGSTLELTLGRGPKTAGAIGTEEPWGAAFAWGTALALGTALVAFTAGVAATAAKGKAAMPIRAAEKLKRRTPKPWNYA